mmetsp:Transcript_75028/g.141495  ORF Transcript_75028/g.141495 Transcript_75028/m.141495 type:complete len:111 (-) Transcript_75028:13-345(-)
MTTMRDLLPRQMSRSGEPAVVTLGGALLQVARLQRNTPRCVDSSLHPGRNLHASLAIADGSKCGPSLWWTRARETPALPTDCAPVNWRALLASVQQALCRSPPRPLQAPT